MKIDVPAVRKCLKEFDFSTLFREHLGWDNHHARLDIPVDGNTFHLTAFAQKRGFVAFVCPSTPDRATRLKIDQRITKSVHEHFVIYTDQAAGRQVWHWVRREPGKPLASRDHRFAASQSGDPLIQRLNRIAVSLDEEEKITVVDVAGRARAAFDVDKVTRKFYDRFKAEHAVFLKLIKGIKSDADLQWYTSLMLNRLMFVYFIQKKGFLDGDVDYLRNRLQMVRQAKGKDKFQSFYRYFLLCLFHDGLGKSPNERKLDADLAKLLGKVPYLNGGFFEVHQLEERNADIDIPDKAFEKLFDFFDQYSWHLDERPLRADNEINPDVVGYIFEKYVNQKQMGAYYTKEDITEYIGKNTIIPYLFDAAEKKCPIAFKPGSFLWRLLSDDPDRYIYPAVRHGVIDGLGNVIPLPMDIEPGVHDVSRRNGWNKPAPEPYALPTETWREHVARRARCLELRRKLMAGEVSAVNDLITLNLDVWQFARDAIIHSEGPELLRAFWQAIEKVTVLDPTCGSGAFLFAALRILETLYSDCMERMERFVEDLAGKSHHPEQFSDFKKVLAQIAGHPNERYFILKSIIINNLFGVDIMEEAVEICKLRLFLKLVAQVEEVGQIEPLPDIDFNIRAGNTLVGYATDEQARAAFTEERAGRQVQGRLLLGESEAAYARFQEDAEMVDRAFRQFRAQQTIYGGKVTHKDKRELRRRLERLGGELDRHLAYEYGIDPDKKSAFEKWRVSHQPFHWFVEFYGIMHGGGFDVIIGNPPYLERSKLSDSYSVRSYRTEACRDIYAWVVERAFHLKLPEARIGLIIPVSLASSESFAVLRDIVNEHSKQLWLSHFANRPGQLFVGAQNRLTIFLSSGSEKAKLLCSTRYHRWDAKNGERESLFHLLTYAKIDREKIFHGLFPKVGTVEAVSILNKVDGLQTLGMALTPRAKFPVYWVRVPGYFCQFFLTPPKARPEKGGPACVRGEVNSISASDEQARGVIHSVLNSSTYFQFFCAYTDGRHINPSDVTAFPFDINEVGDALAKRLRKLSDRLDSAMKNNTVLWRKSGLLIDSVDSRPLKPILDEIDAVLAERYKFTLKEYDYIINYDIKYRMGQEPAEESPE
jgi:hypothetical protein